MKISEITSMLRKIGEYYSKLPDIHKSTKKFAFYKGSNILTSEFGEDFEVDEHFDFTILPGIGEGIQSRILSFIKGEPISELVELSKKSAIFESLDSKLQAIFRSEGIMDDSDIESAILDHKKCHVVPDSIIEKLGRIRTTKIKPIIDSMPCLSKFDSNIKLVGSYRRGIPTVKDLDFLIVAGNDSIAESVIKSVIDGNKELLITKINNGTVMRKYQLSKDGVTINADFKVIPAESIGTAMIHFTGPAKFNIVCRAAAKKLGYTLNEYGFYQIGSDFNLFGGFSEEMVIRELLKHGIKVPFNPSERK